MKTRIINKFALAIAACFLAQQVLATDSLVVQVENNYMGQDGSTYTLKCTVSSLSGLLISVFNPDTIPYGSSSSTRSDIYPQEFMGVKFKVHCDIIPDELSAFKSTKYYFSEIFYLTFDEVPGVQYLPSINPPKTQLDVTVPTGYTLTSDGRRLWQGAISLEKSPF